MASRHIAPWHVRRLFPDLWRAWYVHRVLDGVRLAELPEQQARDPYFASPARR